MLLQQLGVCHDPLHAVQEPTVDACELIQALHRVASPQSSCHHKDPLICRRLQLLMGEGRQMETALCRGRRRQNVRQNVPNLLSAPQTAWSMTVIILEEGTADQRRGSAVVKTWPWILALPLTAYAAPSKFNNLPKPQFPHL